MTNKHSVAFCLTVRSPSVSKDFRLSAIPLNQNQGIFIFIYIIIDALIITHAIQFIELVSIMKVNLKSI